MLPTLNGRLQTRVFVTLVVGGLWTLLITPLLSLPGTVADAYATTVVLLVALTLLGVGWELVYHLLQQFRWEKDWPTFFGLVTAINEGVLLRLLLEYGAVPGIDGPVPLTAFLVQFVSTWLVVWLTVNGPMRVPFVHWRFRGGRIV